MITTIGEDGTGRGSDRFHDRAPAHPPLPLDCGQYLGLVYRVCSRVLRRPSDIDDAVQETFIKFAEHAGEIRSNPASWLHSCAHTTALNVAKRLRARERRRRPLDEMQTAASAQAPSEDSRVRQVDACLAELSEAERAVVLSYFFRDRTLDAIADETGMSKSGVKKRLDRALESLRGKLLRRGLAPGLVASMLSDLQAAQAPVPAAMAQRAGDAFAPTRAARAAAATTAAIGAASSLALVAAILVCAVSAIIWMRPAARAESAQATSHPLAPVVLQPTAAPAAIPVPGHAVLPMSAWQPVGGLPGSADGQGVTAAVGPVTGKRDRADCEAGFDDLSGFRFGARTLGLLQREAIDVAQTDARLSATVSFERTSPGDELDSPLVVLALTVTHARLAQDFLAVGIDLRTGAILCGTREANEAAGGAANLLSQASDDAMHTDGLAALVLHDRFPMCWRSPRADYRIRCDPIPALTVPRTVELAASPARLEVRIDGKAVWMREGIRAGSLQAYAIVLAPDDCARGVVRIDAISLTSVAMK
jgi:RNA polymerase sigma factor (sigma-70 family)